MQYFAQTGTPLFNRTQTKGKMMSAAENTVAESFPCSWQSPSVCEGCPAKDHLRCRLDRKDMAAFLMMLLPYGITTIAGTIRSGYGNYLFLWLAYSLIFFFVWEARILCRHCPFWAEKGIVLHCHANNGVLILWKYEPGPMDRGEKIQLILGALIFIAFPFPFLVLGSEYLLSVISLSTAASAIFLLRRFTCSRCINFSCPMNTVPKHLVDAYLKRNPDIRSAWEGEGQAVED
jgi:hypothetical protein